MLNHKTGREHLLLPTSQPGGRTKCHSGEEKKVDRLYLEVRYARDSCVSFPKNSDIFRLKKNYKKLDSKTYGDNLVIFLDKISYRKNVDMADFETALLDL